jgi:hypothetical protein
MVSSWQLNWWIAEVHRHLGQTRKLAEIGNSNRPVPFSGSLWERKTRVSARSESFRGKNLDRRDSLAERGEFELPVPISEQPDDNMMSGSGTRRSIGIARGLKRLVGLYGQQHSKETFPS